ncbi:MAG: FAD:protein FMN transferase [Nevskiaceae bacterium]|nr:MAG: FAD:protein FMN transferase [Nevskiaceae bacterium]TBR73093.1 MAG: FAD:protein FMN transferase [Nevskiaceae bacterium]
MRVAEVERARPLLGTFVSMRVGGLPPARAQRAIDLAFAEVQAVQRRMSFHDPDSELSQLNRQAARRAVTVHPQTWRVLARALRIAAASGGSFDPSVAPRLVALGVLPAPAAELAPDPAADWRDVRLLPGFRVRFRRPLWLDLGGIAKGHAVDRALARLRRCGATTACVDAGGDLRLFGPEEEAVALRGPRGRPRPVVWLRDGALASSAVEPEDDALSGRVLDGRRGWALAPGRRVTVAAAQAWLADALTKVVLADPPQARDVLARCAAQAWLHTPDGGWHRLPR